MLKRIKRIPSHSGHARWFAETSDAIGEIRRREDIPSPYRYSPSWSVYRWANRFVICVETAHRQYDVFEVPASMVLPLGTIDAEFSAANAIGGAS